MAGLSALPLGGPPNGAELERQLTDAIADLQRWIQELEQAGKSRP
jgi:hypothetical protein